MDIEKVLLILSQRYSLDSEEIDKDMIAAINAGRMSATPLWKEMFGEDITPTPEEFLEKVRERVVELIS